ncbi:MAG TPA: SDR family oxidoreductase [Vicinamibacterales bacterium]|nr:SDR family oxidoreductase [Vicinamibacterales bacterium]
MSAARPRFADRVVLVTGGASGIGLATINRCASEGAAVVIADIDQKTADAAIGPAMEQGAPGAIAVACDVSDETQVAACVNRTIEKFGRLDVIVNNAGLMVFKSIEEHTREDWMRLLAVDLLGAFYFIREAFRVMKNGGAIVNVSSIHAVETTPLVCSYAAAKAALVSLTRSAAIEGKPHGIRVNAILPGAIDTPMLWENPNIKSGLEQIQRSDVGRAEDVASAIAFLASDDARFVQGTEFRVDGGRLGRL